MSLIRKHGAVLQAWACLALVSSSIFHVIYVFNVFLNLYLNVYYIYAYTNK